MPVIRDLKLCWSHFIKNNNKIKKKRQNKVNRDPAFILLLSVHIHVHCLKFLLLNIFWVCLPIFGPNAISVVLLQPHNRPPHLYSKVVYSPHCWKNGISKLTISAGQSLLKPFSDSPHSKAQSSRSWLNWPWPVFQLGVHHTTSSCYKVATRLHIYFSKWPMISLVMWLFTDKAVCLEFPVTLDSVLMFWSPWNVPRPCSLPG